MKISLHRIGEPGHIGIQALLVNHGKDSFFLFLRQPLVIQIIYTGGGLHQDAAHLPGVSRLNAKGAVDRAGINPV